MLRERRTIFTPQHIGFFSHYPTSCWLSTLAKHFIAIRIAHFHLVELSKLSYSSEFHPVRIIEIFFIIHNFYLTEFVPIYSSSMLFFYEESFPLLFFLQREIWLQPVYETSLLGLF